MNNSACKIIIQLGWLVFWTSGPYGCFGSIAEPSRRYYTLNVEPLTGSTSQHPLRPTDVVRVRDLDVDSIYDRFQMVLRRNSFELTYRQRHVWAVKPNRMISDLLARGLSHRHMFGSVMRELGERRPDFFVSGDLHALEMYDSPTTWYAHLALSLRLTHFETGKVLWTFSYEDRKPVPPKNFAYGVRALSELLSIAVEQALASMEKNLLEKGSVGEAPAARSLFPNSIPLCQGNPSFSLKP